MSDEIGRMGIEGMEVTILWAPDAGLVGPVEVIEGIEGSLFVVFAESRYRALSASEDGPRELASLATQAAFDYLYGVR